MIATETLAVLLIALMVVTVMWGQIGTLNARIRAQQDELDEMKRLLNPKPPTNSDSAIAFFTILLVIMVVLVVMLI